MPYKDPAKRREYDRRWRQRRNAETGRAYLNEYRQKLKAIVEQAKADRPCSDCGKKYPPYVMDFDHRPGEQKVLAISDMVNVFGPKRLAEELRKCDLVCANCHRERTHQRKIEVLGLAMMASKACGSLTTR